MWEIPNFVAMVVGYMIILPFGFAIAFAIAWLAVEFCWKRWGDFRLLREFFIWKRDKDRIPG